MSLGVRHRNLGGCDPCKVAWHRFCASICTAKKFYRAELWSRNFAAAQNCLARILSLREILHRLAFERPEILNCMPL